MISLLHISDLHIGEIPQGLDSFESRPASRKPRQLPSSRGHDPRVAWDLSNIWADLRNAYPATKIIVTGDVTRQGRGAEFGCAHRYLHAYWLINPTANTPLRIGLRAGGDKAITIPGNHDFWPGTVLGSPFVKDTILQAHFWPLPWLYIISDASEAMELHLVGLNSCSGLNRISLSQAIARGAITQAHLDDAERLFSQAQVTANNRKTFVVRAVLLHHPPDHLTRNSHRRLKTWLRRNNVQAILTGHTHQHRLPQPAASPPFEFCCGTTFQAGTRTKLPGREPNFFYFHSLRLDHSLDKKFVWMTFSYWHNGIKWVSKDHPDWTSAQFSGLTL